MKNNVDFSQEDQPMWQPSQAQINNANITSFINTLNNKNITDYYSLQEWSINKPDEFWSKFWSFAGVLSETKGELVIENPHNIEKARFFPQAKLNFAENLLKRRDNQVAIVFYGEDKVKTTMTYAELYHQTSQLVQAFKEWGIKPGDRIASFLPNMEHTIVAMLASSAIGAVFSTCSPDFGTDGVIDRFGQISPKVLITADGYHYNGKSFDCLERIKTITTAVPSIENTLIVPYINPEPVVADSQHVWGKLLQNYSPQDIQFAQLPFGHPLYILYSSGTTGQPKCIVHSAGGTLLQHMKEHMLHCDVKPGDKMFYFTTCSWMMWHWLVTGLASDASLVLYDGSPTYPSPTRLFDIADEAGVTLFGTSAKFIDAIAGMGAKPAETNNLSTIRTITSTGSPLVPESYDYVYKDIKDDVNLASISGGTDIISCFMIGNPVTPVWRGELQTAGLGMDVQVYDQDGQAVIAEKGELVCTNPFPSQPIGFWNDENSEKYHDAYYAEYPGIWHHGDFVEQTNHGGYIIHGRSDAVLNPGGVRIGTAEIYRQVEQIEEVMEAIVVGQNWQRDVRVVLFIKLQDGIILDDGLRMRIKKQIRSQTTPRHVPAVILQVADIPRTRNGKIAELAVRNIIHDEPIKNLGSLANPESLEHYKNRTELI